MVFNFFAALLRRKWKIKSWVASLKHVLILNILPETLFKELVSAVSNPPVTVKLAP